MNAIYQAALTFASQNWGAGKLDRVKKVMWNCLAAVTVIGLALGMLVLLLGRPLLSVYVRSDSEDFEAIIRAGLTRISYPGSMSAPIPGEAHDGAYPLRRYLRIVDVEIES
jgi:Na+-driven multidrug efflux pump